MDALIPVALPWLGEAEAEAEAARRPILGGWVMQGPEVAAFEGEFAAHVGAAHVCAVSSCTTALHLGLLAVGVGPGDEVITASHSFVATANSVRYCGAKPVFVDIQPGTFNIDPELIERAITAKTPPALARTDPLLLGKRDLCPRALAGGTTRLPPRRKRVAVTPTWAGG